MEPAVNTLIDTSTGRAIDLAMQSLEVTGRVYPVGSFVRVIHRFRCLGTKPMEAIYVSMLPTNGTLRRFKVIGENFESDSRLEKRAKARKEYEEGVADGHLSVLAETNMDGLVNLTVGQVQPDEEISVIMDVVVGVDTKDDGFRFRYPFTLAPSYHPQAKASATEAGGTIELPSDVFGDLVLPEWRNSGFGLHEVSFNLRVYGGDPLTACSSPSHRITVAPQADGCHLISLAGMGDTPNRDLVLDVSVPEAKALVFADETLLGKTSAETPQVPTGAARWTAVVPSDLIPATTRQPRKVCFLIDRSGSMTGSRDYDPTAPILKAKQALKVCLSALHPEDEFGIVHFGSDTVKFDNQMAKADDTNRARADKWVKEIRCHGGTNMLGALSAATQVLGGPGGDIFLLTDGEVWQTGPIVEHMSASGSRVHVLGIGTASQHRFMAQLARRTGGVTDMVSPSEDVATSGLKLFNKVREPVLTDAEVQVDGTKVKAAKTVWGGLPLLVTDSKGDGALPGTILVGGDGLKDHAVSKFVQLSVPDGLVALLWAGRRIEDLSSKMDMTSAGTPTHDRIVTRMEGLSVAYSLASRVMSLVAVVERTGDQAGVTPEQTVVAVGTPEGQNPAGVFPVTVSHDTILNAQPAAAHAFLGATARGAQPRRSMSAFSGSGFAKGLAGGGQLYSMGLGSPMQSFDGGNTRGLGGPSVAPETTTSCSVNQEPTTGGEPNLISDSLSSDPGSGAAFDGIDHIAPVPACGPATAAAEEDGTFKYTGNLLVDLSGLMADGGVRGDSLDERVFDTAVLLLLTTVQAAKFPGVFDQHIDKMVAFLTTHKKAVNGQSTVIHKAVRAAERKAVKASEATLEGLYGITSGADAWAALRDAI